MFFVKKRAFGKTNFIKENVMNKMLLLTGVATTMFAFGVDALEYTPYVSAKLSYALATHDFNSWKLKADNKKRSHDFNDEIFGGNVAYGVKMGHVRTEMELNLKQKAEQDFRSSKSAAKLSVENRFALLNVYYDFNFCSNFTPYVGTGLGMAYLKAKEKGAYSDNISATASDSKKTFVWQIGAGVA